jgi:predicted dehydrogenase
MTQPDPIGVALVGAGFLAETRARCYAATQARVVAIASSTRARADAFAARHGIPRVCADLDELLGVPGVDLVDLCVPNHLHRPFAEAAAAAGKHVVCTKPLSAYVGQDLAPDAPDEAVSATPRARMLEVAVADARAMVDAARANGVQLMYGENWVHAPAIRRARELLVASGGAALELRGWESHSGSHTPYAKLWRYNGGGALIRLAAHPIGAMLHLKRAEGLARNGVPIRPLAVTAETADVSPAGAATGREVHVGVGWKDVENWGCAVLAFDDGSRGVAYGSDTLLGGMESKLEVLASNCHLKCNLSPNDLLRSYAPADGVFGDQYMMEKASTQAGWNTPIPNEDWSSGHMSMCAEFVAAARAGRPAASDGELGLDVTRVVYAAYVSSAEGRRVQLA